MAALLWTVIPAKIRDIDIAKLTQLVTQSSANFLKNFAYEKLKRRISIYWIYELAVKILQMLFFINFFLQLQSSFNTNISKLTVNIKAKANQYVVNSYSRQH